MSEYYVILTGSKNNAGDFLIKHRAKKLFEAIRPDREIIDLNAWEPIDDQKLALINSSKALILMGGPALQRNMYPGIYKLPANLDEITVPIATMGIGWKSIIGNWQDTYNYPLNETTIKLLDRIKADGLTSSVRDFHTLNVLASKGYDNFLMTGCPAYYDLGHIEKPFEYPEIINKVAFSLGVSFIHSSSMEKQMKAQILRLKAHFSGQTFEVVFHHALEADKFLKTHGATATHNKRHNDFANWLASQNIAYVDISGSAENLINYYSQVDLHVGYRVHAHIFMNSVKKLSILISEDGRAKGSKSVISGMVIDGYHAYRVSFIHKVANKLWSNFDRYEANAFAVDEIINTINYETKTKGHHAIQSSSLIQENFKIMTHFLNELP